MRGRTWLVAMLLACASTVLAAVILPAVPDGTLGSLAVATVAALLVTALAVAAGLPRVPAVVVVLAPDRRLRGRFLQQSRPGVPGRIRARAPGCGR